MASSSSTTAMGLTASQKDQFLSAASESIAYHSGKGSRLFTMQNLMSKHDRFGTAPFQLNADNPGLTFFTRPKLNFRTSNLRSDRHLALLDTIVPLDLMFGLRCILDTNFAKWDKIKKPMEASPWINNESPFNIPLGNALTGISGFPDYSLEYETSESGWFGEDQTLARGGDRGRRTYQIACTFRDMQGSVIMAMLFYWIHYMILQMEGIVVPYPEDREANRLNYTCSIYRFVLDPSLTTITKWAKATGCFPLNVPWGDVFNFSPGDTYIHTSQQFTIPFIANHISYMDPADLAAFNFLVRRYAGTNVGESGVRTQVTRGASGNFKGVPYIELFKGTNELMWLAKKEELIDPSADIMSNLLKSVSTTTSDLIDRYTTTDPLGETS